MEIAEEKIKIMRVSVEPSAIWTVADHNTCGVWNWVA